MKVNLSGNKIHAETKEPDGVKHPISKRQKKGALIQSCGNRYLGDKASAILAETLK